MKGRNTFTAAEAEETRAHLKELRAADRKTQKRIRRTLRDRYEFYIDDFRVHGAGVHREGCTVADFDCLVRGAVIRIQEP